MTATPLPQLLLDAISEMEVSLRGSIDWDLTQGEIIDQLQEAYNKLAQAAEDVWTISRRCPPAPGDSHTIVLSGRQLGAVLGLVRGGIRKINRGARQALHTFGDDYDGTAHRRRHELLHETYRALGSDPGLIENSHEGDPI